MNSKSKHIKQKSKQNTDESSNDDYFDEFSDVLLTTEEDNSEDDGTVEILYLECATGSDSENESTTPKKIVIESSKNLRNKVSNKLKGTDNDTKRICRLCLKNVSEEHLNIFKNRIDNGTRIYVAILSCIQPLKIIKEDNLSDKVCAKCFLTVQKFSNFRRMCILNDREQRKLLKANEYKSQTKRKTREHNFKRKRRRITETDYETDSIFNDIVEVDEDYEESLIEFFEREKIDIEEDKLVKIENLDKADVEVEISTTDKIEEELRQLIEGSLSKEQAQAENIIIHVQNDDEDENETLTEITELKLPIVIKPVEPKKHSPPSRKVIVDFEKDVSSSEEHDGISNTGLFQATHVNYLFDFEFCILDEYVFEYRLSKGRLRYLRCVLPTCPAKGIQDKIKDGLYSNLVSVKTSHNHPKPDEMKRKKQMFFFVMKRKLYSDKGINIKKVYEEICVHDPDIEKLVPLKHVISVICKHQMSYKLPVIQSFQQLLNSIEEDSFEKLQFTQNGKQFYQEKFVVDSNSQAIVFGNKHIIDQVCDSQLMYVDASFRIDSSEDFKYNLITVLVWVEESYYPIYYGLVSAKSRELYKMVLQYLHDILAPQLRPKEIITDFEANLYYALGEVYVNSTIGGSVFYYTQNLYKKICSLNLSRDLETNGNFRNIYHMLLMLPLLPVNTILAGLNNIETQARDLHLSTLMRPLFDHVRSEWIIKVTPNFFCVHKLENRINENVTAPFKKLRDYLMLTKGKSMHKNITIVTVIQKLIELEYFLQTTYSAPTKKSFARDLSSSQKRNVIKAWQFIERHPKININNFFERVVGYIRCMENQLWIWGFYRFSGDINDELINAANFSIISSENDVNSNMPESNDDSESEFIKSDYAEVNETYEDYIRDEDGNEQIVIDAIVDEKGVVQTNKSENSGFNKSFMNYVENEREECK